MEVWLLLSWFLGLVLLISALTPCIRMEPFFFLSCLPSIITTTTPYFFFIGASFEILSMLT
ncbi:hypothetical protein BDV26DRAFT_272016 [Aspergillus bertholletiae]|uniref:Uncharacterized protein n=1 Tax=Aspergillus bertholletiae TaxID=1226010 RepID=A0A5N7AU97_9EURO|nr:hypothetical protein BDV26DRAFT_272016 [Aspergillus bertholletiae]